MTGVQRILRQRRIAHGRQPLPALAVGALGVVYGDIGTSPLYTIKEIFIGTHPLSVDRANVLGILSLIFWSLTIVVSLKYVVFMMRADNHGEGGIMAMLALVRRVAAAHPRLIPSLVSLGIFGAALFYGDSIITPAISVLSAVEGLEVALPTVERLVDPIALVILIALFLIQRRGTASVGVLFGPVMIIWFAILAGLGLLGILHFPEVLRALDPRYAFSFFTIHGFYGFLVLGAVVLAVTGAEALYADMGHFGRQPIRLAWFLIVLPALVLNYFGQGALLLHDPGAVRNPFYLLAPAWGMLPLVVLSTLATIIASQAVITGAYSITRQAIQLGYLPRMEIRHTSWREMGQIYMPLVNWFLLAGVLALVIGFRSSSALAAAYGIAVTGTMAISTVLGYVVVSVLWRWHPALTTLGLALFLIVDLAFVGANTAKLMEGGWFPLTVGALIFVLLSTWKRGRALLRERTRDSSVPLRPFLASLEEYPPTRVPGTAVFLTSHPDIVPRAFLHNLAHNKVMHERILFLTVVLEPVPQVPQAARFDVVRPGDGLFQVALHFGFMQIPDIPRALARCHPCGDGFNLLETSFFLSRETLIPTKVPGMALWREYLFAWMARNAQSAMGFYRIPTNRVIELGTQVEL
jgi:KUP system potassium uptake protein